MWSGEPIKSGGAAYRLSSGSALPEAGETVGGRAPQRGGGAETHQALHPCGLLRSCLWGPLTSLATFFTAGPSDEAVLKGV